MTSERPTGDAVGPPRRLRILNAAVQLVGARGYHAATVAAITARARVTRPTFYAAFPGGKRECVRCAYEMTIDCVCTIVSDACRGLRGRHAVTTGLTALIHALLADLNAARLCLLELGEIDPDSFDLWQRTIVRFAALLHDADGGQLESERAQLIVAGWWHLVFLRVIEESPGQLQGEIPQMLRALQLFRAP